MNQMKRLCVWLSRVRYCRGFGIQSPTDYAFVRYVVNEHWPYYAYERLKGSDWLERKLGRLYLRLANWRRPLTMKADAYQNYWRAGCRMVQFSDDDRSCELVRVMVGDRQRCEHLLAACDEHSLMVVEGIWRDWDFWHAIERADCVGTTFDLYYCGIVMFDRRPYKHHYKINF